MKKYEEKRRKRQKERRRERRRRRRRRGGASPARRTRKALKRRTPQKRRHVRREESAAAQRKQRGDLRFETQTRLFFFSRSDFFLLRGAGEKPTRVSWGRTGLTGSPRSRTSSLERADFGERTRTRLLSLRRTCARPTAPTKGKKTHKKTQGRVSFRLSPRSRGAHRSG